jgi:uncharacterized protein
LSSITKTVLVIAGTICVGIGIIGIVLPLIPTTPFLLLGAACYIRGSEKLYDKLISNKYLGTYIKNYREGKGIPFKAKVYAIALLWTSIVYSAVFVISDLVVKVILLLIAAGVTLHISSFKNNISTKLEDDEVGDSK